MVYCCPITINPANLSPIGYFEYAFIESTLIPVIRLALNRPAAIALVLDDLSHNPPMKTGRA